MEENHSEEASETRRRTVLGALERVGAEEQSQGRGGCLFKRTSKRCSPSSLSRTLLRGHVIILKSLRQIRGVGEEFI